jgi:hypothetical protein
MKNHRLISTLFWIATGAAFLVPAFAETATENPEYLKVGKIKSVVIKVGQTADAVVPAKVMKGHHIQANPATLPNLIATELNVEALKGLEVKSPVYPPSKPWKLTNTGKVIQTYDGDLEIKIALAAKDLKPGKYELKGSLRYQACNEKNCFFPTSAPITIPVTVVK